MPPPKVLTVPSLILATLAATGLACAPQTEPAQPTPQAPAVATVPGVVPKAAPDLLARRELPLATRPLALLARDFDGDGFDDLAVVTEQPGRLRLFAGSPSGLLLSSSILTIGDFPTNLIETPAGQLRVASKATGELLSISVERANGELEASIDWRTKPGGTPRVIASLGQDGHTLWATNDERVLIASQGGIKAALTLETGARTVGLLASQAGDRFALLCQGTGDLRVYTVAAEPALLRRINFAGVPRSACEADLDGDGDWEAAVIGADDRVMLFGLDAKTGFMEGDPVVTTQPVRVPAALQHHDLNGDGREELISLGLIDQAYFVMGEFTAQAPYRSAYPSEYAGQDPVDMALGDFDGDGRMDMAAACRGAMGISLLGGSGVKALGNSAFNQARRTGVGANPLSIATVDLFGTRTATGFGAPDERAEVATLDAADGMLSVMLNNGYGGLDVVQRLAVGAAPRGLNALLIDGRGLLVALTTPAGQAAELRAFAAQPGQAAAPIPITLTGPVATLPLPASDEGGVQACDINSDGNTDLFLLDPGAPKLHILLGRGLDPTGVTFEATPPITLPGIASAAAFAVTRSGPRFAVAIGHEIVLLAPDGKQLGRLDAPANTRTGRGCIRILALDLDGDQNPDDLASLWLGPDGTSPGRLATHCDIAGTYLDFSLPTGYAPADLITGDLNNDGLPELLVAAQNSHIVNMWLNTGSGGFQLTPDIGVGLGPVDLALADLAGKGFIDLLVANAFSADISLVLNRPR